MIAESTDIKFACSHCGQRIVVEKAAAGLSANCPICEGAVTVPYVSSSSTQDRSARTEERGEGRQPTGFTEPGLEETREELFTSASEQGYQQRELDAANHEIARLQALFKKAVDECERVTANATHAQAELKSFQSDRQQLKAELAQARHRAQTAENQVGELAAGLAAASEENAALREQIENDLEVSHERISATETQLEARERELAHLHAESAEVVQSLASTQAEAAGLQVELDALRDELECAQQLLNEAGQIEERRVSTEQELRARLEASINENQRVSQERDQIRAEADSLRHDLTQTDSGRELLELRNRARELADNGDRTASALEEKSAEARALAETERRLREELQESREQREDAERRAEANSEAQLVKDNEVLRGIIARQNDMLGVNHVEVRRLRRGRYTLRAVYALFGLGLLGLVFFALSIFTQKGFEELFSELLR